ncbi:MAG: hypothetical protein IJX51_00145 [Clostridia bacterium]|nr:hypothetical protein [Clostridia bacterium]
MMNSVKKTNKLLLTCLIAVICVFASLTAYVMAKYYNEATTENSVDSVNMLFVCKDANGKYYENGKIYYALEGSSLDFYMHNNDQGIISNAKIEYETKVESDTSPITQTGTLNEDVATSQPGASIANVKQGVTYTVTISVTKPYTETISFTVIPVKDELATYYNLEDKGEYVQLDLFVGNTGGNIDVTVDFGGLSPDSLNAVTSPWTKGTPGVITATPYTHYTIYFFKNGDTSIYSSVSEEVITDPYSITFNVA